MKANNCLIIFTRKPELGKVKTRLAADIGDKQALKIYKYLLSYSSKVCASVNADKHVWYTPEIEYKDHWDNTLFKKHLQPEGDLGEKMQFAFDHAFKENYQNVVIIGTDLVDIDQELIDHAFALLEFYDVVIGPATDGGYYLLGLNKMIEPVFKNKIWGTSEVFQLTMNDLKTKNVAVLEYKNDIDYVEDLNEHPELLKLIEK